VTGAGSNYRADIDGLRAIAVAAVVGFHALPGLVPGGFVGVDIFFVISGYLITGVIAGDLAAGTFTLKNFYLRRVRRIFPALAAMLVVATVIAWACLLPDEWRQFGKHLFAGAAFVSNLAFAREGGYFEWAAHFKPLLHLWSLGVEEQFYFVWPLFLALLWRTSRPVRVTMLIAAMVLSFAVNLAAIGRYPALTFYLPFTRVWELAIGSVLALLWIPPTRRAFAELSSWSGGVLLIASIVVIRENRAFPGAWALLPTIGTALVIAAGPRASLNRLLLANRALVFVGLISYPLYLWHWPLLSFSRIVRGGDLDALAIFTCVALSVLLAVLTFRFIEKPIRRTTSFSARLLVVCAVLVVVACVGLAAAARRLEPRLSSPAIDEVVAAASDWSYPFGLNFGKADAFERSTVPGSAPRAVLFIGDSHLEQYWPRLQHLSANGRGPELRFVTNGGCPPLPGVAVERGDVCRRYLVFAFAEARDPAVTTVVLGAYWPIYLDAHGPNQSAAAMLTGFGAEIHSLVRSGKRVYVILASPVSPKLDPRRLVSRRDGHIESQLLPLREFLADTGASIDAVRDVATRSGAIVIDPLPVLCAGGTCPAMTVGGRAIYRDGSHLRPFYVREHASFVDRVLN
jgi:peptidoglycan/LPS O-acetylase OafA/YrhL